jgi:hypothetical protein
MMMLYVDAKAIDIAAADDATLVAAWHSHASYISYLEADDYGNDWKLAGVPRAHARTIEVEIRNRGIERKAR